MLIKKEKPKLRSSVQSREVAKSRNRLIDTAQESKYDTLQVNFDVYLLYIQ